MTHAAARGWLVTLMAGALALLCGTARADPPTPKRATPDYDGRGPAPTRAGDVALWIPRILLSPLYATNEFLIRRPLAVVVPAAERVDLPRKIYDFFFFGPDHKAGVLPIGFVEFNFNPSVGAYAFWDDAFFPGHDLRFHGEVWTHDWLAGSLTERVRFHGKDTVQLRVSAMRRPDHMFFGTGPGAQQSHQSRYGQDTLDGGVTLAATLWRASRVETAVGVRSVSFYPGHFGADPSIEREAATGAFALPDGFARGYTAEYNRVFAAFDTRRPWPLVGSGIRVELQAEQGSDVKQLPASGWIRYGVSGGAFYDVNGHRRVLSLSVATLFADPLGTRPVPFTELVSLGGDAPMRGFYAGRLLDRSAAATTARYVWPIGPWIDGSLQVAVGNVFGDHLEAFKARLLRLSAALGLVVTTSPDTPIELLLGFGTETFDQKAQLDTVRVAFGVNRF